MDYALNKSRFVKLIHTIFILSLAVLCCTTNKLHAQPATYPFLGNEVQNVDAFTGEVNSTAKLLLEQILSPSEIQITTIRYAPDLLLTGSNGQQFMLERKMDFYSPTDTVKYLFNGEEILNLPLIVIMHTGQGDRISAGESGMKWARMGYNVLIPSVRTGRNETEYCAEAPLVIYNAVQDARAAVRTFSQLYDLAQTESYEFIASTYGMGKAELTEKILKSRVDGFSIFYQGLSFGGSVSYHMGARVVQEQYEEFLIDPNGYVIDGNVGSKNIGAQLPLDGVGVANIQDYPFPYERTRGTISRTASITPIDIVDYSLNPHPVPACFFHGTCDALVPYRSNTLIGNVDNYCDAQVTYPDGSSTSTFTYHGSSIIATNMQEAGIYNELVTFCGGGHDSNLCVEELIDSIAPQFIAKILAYEIVENTTQNLVYKYDPLNYSSQCCDIGENYGYLEICSCSEDNPYDAQNLSFISLNACLFDEECEIDDYCSLLPSDTLLGVYQINSRSRMQERLFIRNIQSAFQLYSNQGNDVNALLKIIDGQGALLLETRIYANNGFLQFDIPDYIPKSQLLIGWMEGREPIKFILQ